MGQGNGRWESTVFADWANCYLGSNDPYGETLHSILSLAKAEFFNVDRFVSVVGSFVALQFLLILKPRAIHFFDMNPCAVKWAQMLCELITISSSPQEYMSRLFARDVAAFEWHDEYRRLLYLNQHRFLKSPPCQVWRETTCALLSPSARATYEEILVPLQAGAKTRWYTPRLVPCEDRRELKSLARSGLGAQGRLPLDGRASFLYGEGWLTSQLTFDNVKRKLQTVPITWSSGVDFPTVRSGDICQDISGDVCQDISSLDESQNVLIFAMDMWSSNFARQWWPKEMMTWRPKCGRLVVIQSITAGKHELVRELVGDVEKKTLAWQSFSDWKSEKLLPTHIWQCGVKPDSLYGHPLILQSDDLQVRRVLRELLTARRKRIAENQ